MGHVKALILACVDDRLQNDLVRFADERGWAEEFVLMTVPGDCLDIAHCNNRGLVDMERLTWLLAKKQPEYLVIVAHQDCAARKEAALIGPETPVRVQAEMCANELHCALREIFAVAHDAVLPKVELFFARQKRDIPDDFDFIKIPVLGR